MKKNLKNFREYCGETLGALVNPVKNQMGATLPEFWEELENVSRSPYGAGAGFTGFIYYSETISFWKRNRKAIMAYAQELAKEFGGEYARAGGELR